MIDAIADTTVIQGNNVSVPITVKRGDGVDGDVTITVTGLEDGVTSSKLTIAAGSSAGTLEIKTTATAAQARLSPAVRADAAAASTVATSKLIIRGPAGAVDTTFGTAGQISSVFGSASLATGFDLLPLPDGSFLVVSGLSITKMKGNGQIDGTYGVAGRFTLSASLAANSVALAPDGSVLMASQPSTSFLSCVARVDPTGALDAQFGDDTLGKGQPCLLVPAGVTKVDHGPLIAVDATGSIFLASSVVIGTTSNQVVTKLTPKGSLAPGFTPSFQNFQTPHSFVLALAPDSSGNTIGVGLGMTGTTSSSPTTGFYGFRFLSNGAVDTTFGTPKYVSRAPQATAPPLQQIVGTAIGPDGSITTAFASSPGSGIQPDLVSGYVMTLKPNGQLDTDFGFVNVGIGPVSDVARTSDGKVLVAKRGAVWRLAASGTIDASFAGGSVTPTFNTNDVSITNVASLSDGRIVVLGSWTDNINQGDLLLNAYWP